MCARERRLREVVVAAVAPSDPEEAETRAACGDFTPVSISTHIHGDSSVKLRANEPQYGRSRRSFYFV